MKKTKEKVLNQAANHSVVKPFDRNRWLYIIAAILLIGCLVAGLLFAVNKKEEYIAVNPISKEVFDDTINKLQSNSNISTEESDKLVDESVKSTNDNYQKTLLLITSASLYYDSADYDKSIQIALRAYDIEPNDNVCGFIARAYETKGDKNQAIKYYNYAIDYLTKNNPQDGDIGYYGDMIKVLNGQTLDYEE